MSDDAAQLINTFAALSPRERYTVIVELARISEGDAGPVSGQRHGNRSDAGAVSSGRGWSG
jgi:hypothetical protein